MRILRHITWEVFSRDYIKPYIPAIYEVPGTPIVRLYVSDKAARIGVKVLLEEQIILPALPLKEISLDLRIEGGDLYADFSTSNVNLYESFYTIMTSIADATQNDKKSPVIAIEEAIERLKNITAIVKLLSEDKIIGIWGELWVLEQLINKEGTNAVYSWKGPEKAIHDFRLVGLELEVKTTRNEERIHIISRLSQLDPSPGFTLFLCSIQIVENYSSGFSLTEYVEKISNLLDSDYDAKRYFEKQLEKEGYLLSNCKFFTKKYYTRTIPKLVEVTENFTKLDRKMIEEKHGENASRINNVNYTLDVSGLGLQNTDPSYIDILG